MKLAIYSISALIGIAFTVWIVNLLKSFVTFVIPALAGYPIATFAIVFAMLIGMCMIIGKIVENCAVEYPYDDRM